MTDSQLQIREASDQDSNAVTGLIAGIFAEYPGCVLDVEREEPDLLAIATSFSKKPGKFWVVSRGDEVAGCLGLVFHEGFAELKKLYVRKSERRRGIARRLLQEALASLDPAAYGRLLAWSDSRFVEAHAFYAQQGFKRKPGSRELHDLSRSVEFAFEMELATKRTADRMP